MINEGASGNTKAEIENVIGNLDVTKYDNIDRILSLANGIYILVMLLINALAMDLKRYNNVQLEFMAIMPNKDLNTYIENFTTDELNKITNKLTLASETKNGLHIFMPKFRFEYELALKEDLIKLGIRDMFGGNADLSNISDVCTYVSEAIHKATIDVKMDGIKAAAVTGLGLKPISGKITKSKEIKIDKPFMFIIRDKNTGEIWFTGALYKPNIV